jgi:hypothetical protein
MSHLRSKEEAIRMDCKVASQARNGKAAQLEREIQDSGATPGQKSNMLHTLSKLGIFSEEERNYLTRLATGRNYYREWLAMAGG